MTVAAIYYVGVTIRTITPDAQEGKIMSSLSFLFWAFLASYVVHILDETLLNGGFVRWIADNFWPTYHVRMFSGLMPRLLGRSRSAMFSLTASAAIG
jgi:hypothetical protein